LNARLNADSDRYFYNAVVTSAILVPFSYVVRAQRHNRGLVRLETPA
jgi:hypothetical protein